MSWEYAWGSEKMKVDYEKYAKLKYFKVEKARIRTQKIVVHHVKKSPLLDIGCGDGILLEILSKKRIKCVGIETSKFATDICRKKGLKVYHKKIEELKNKKWQNKFNTVTMIDLLEHIKNQRKALRIVYNILRKNGELIIVLPNPKSLKSKLGIVENPSVDPYHTHCPTLEETIKLIENCNFKVEEIKGIGRFPLPASLSQAFLIKAKKVEK
jgi:2-polyprenyl-3-methyl-5-hydroxy-6-metoxy-1,4-benzoquinol methylase